MKKETDRGLLISSLCLVFISAFFYALMEWLFYVTKPSFFDALPTRDVIDALIVSGALLSTIGAGLTLALFALLKIGTLISRLPRVSAYMLATIPVVYLTATELLLLDTFTYTLLGIGIVKYADYRRYIYAILFLALLAYNFRWISRELLADHWKRLKTHYTVALSSLLALLASYSIMAYQQPDATALAASGKPDTSLPNILILSGDGIEATRMSAYGYERKTTPFIDSLLDSSLVFENHFTNSAVTTASVISMLTGKLPTATKVIYRPDILRGADSYTHLPGLLRNLGYFNADITTRHYVDARDINMKNGFHWANGRSLVNEEESLLARFSRAYPAAGIFIEGTSQRLSDRVFHILNIHDMDNPFSTVANLKADLPKRKGGVDSDLEKIDQLQTMITQAKENHQPFFMSVHLLGTHGPYFPIVNPHYSEGMEQKEKWMVDFYDDAVKDYDFHVKTIVEFLKKEGLYENTLLILNTDHGMNWSYLEPLPLIIRFPNAQYTGVVKTNSQRVDITPTILDYLEQPIPDWMNGQSLLQQDRDNLEPIFIVNRAFILLNKLGWAETVKSRPPFYSLNTLAVVYCNSWYQLELSTAAFTQGAVETHTNACDEDVIPSAKAAENALIDHLDENGYSVTKLKNDVEKRRAGETEEA